MLKKAGIVVAAATAGLLAVSPLAFAGDKGHDYDDKGHHGSVEIDENTNENGDANSALVNVSGNNANVPIQALNCNDVPVGGIVGGQVPLEDITATLTGALSIFGDAEADSETAVDNSCNSTQGDSGAGDLVEQGIED